MLRRNRDRIELGGRVADALELEEWDALGVIALRLMFAGYPGASARAFVGGRTA